MIHMQTTQTRDPLIGELKAGMARRGFTQTDVANALHTSRAAISRRMSGEVAFDYREIRTLSRFLGVSVATLYGETQPQRHEVAA